MEDLCSLSYYCSPPPPPPRPQQRSSTGKLPSRPSRAAALQIPPRARARPPLDIYEVEPTPEPRATPAAPLPPASSSRGSPHSRTELRRPQYLTEAEWAPLAVHRKRMYSYVGRIDETDDGVTAPVAYDRCVEDECESSCYVYTEAARLKYHKKDAGFGCSRCTKRDKPCSLTVCSIS